MLDQKALRNVKIIVSHDNCGDGTVAALLCRDAIRQAEVRFVQHGTAALKEMKAEPNMLFVDICPPADRVQEFVAAGAIVLDHHKTAKATVEAFGANGVFADETKEPGISGAMLAYREVWSWLRFDEAGAFLKDFAHTMARLTGIRDTWQNQDKDWEKAVKLSHLMHLCPNTQWLNWELETLAMTWTSQFSWLQDVLTDKHNKSVERSIKGGARRTSQKGTRVILFNSLSNTSDAAEVLDDTVDVVAGFSYEQEGDGAKLIFSLRSHTDFDCSAFCKAHGGGGHTKAAGFSVLDGGESGPYQTFMRLLNAYEAR